MKRLFDRREFLAAAAVCGAGACLSARAEDAAWRTSLKKAIIGRPSEELLRDLKAAGFDGIESTDRAATPQKAAAAKKVADALGMKIHSVLYGWANFNKPEAVASDLASVETALRACQAYGADALLLVPCRIAGMKMPEPWEFAIEFDDKTGRLLRVVEGDNAPYAEYIHAHDQAAAASRAAVEKLIPAAEKAGVIIAMENVWNNLWVKPALFAHFVGAFQSPWVKAYFDIGNHVKYAPPEKWIHALGKLIVKCHVKDFKLKPDGHGGEFCDIRDGSVNWPAVRKELDAVGYDGWMTIEGGSLSPQEHSVRLDKILAGE